MERIVDRGVRLLFAASLTCLGACSTGTGNLLIPMGRLAQIGNQVDLSIDGQTRQPSVVSDGCGGSWMAVPVGAVQGATRVELRLSKTSLSSNAQETTVDESRWLAPCPLIDSEEPEVVAKARELLEGSGSREETVRRILRFVCQRIAFATYRGMHWAPASDTLARGSGICVNHARLFVALCRAAGVPARTISGAMYDREALYHHEWAEFHDQTGTWRMLDPTVSTDMHFACLTYIDLIYDIESNPLYPFAKGWERDQIALANGDTSVFCPDWELQRATGRMGYATSFDIVAGSFMVTMSFDVRRLLR